MDDGGLTGSKRTFLAKEIFLFPSGDFSMQYRFDEEDFFILKFFYFRERGK